MFVLKSSISVQVSKKIFGIMNKWRGDPNKHSGRGRQWKKVQKLASGGGRLFGT